MVNAIRRDLPVVVETGAPLRPLLALNEVAPRLVERTVPRFGFHEIMRLAAADRGRLEPGE